MKTGADSSDARPSLSRRDLFRTAGFSAGGVILLGLPPFLSCVVWPVEAESRTLLLYRPTPSWKSKGSSRAFSPLAAVGKALGNGKVMTASPAIQGNYQVLEKSFSRTKQL